MAPIDPSKLSNALFLQILGDRGVCFGYLSWFEAKIRSMPLHTFGIITHWRHAVIIGGCPSTQ